MSLMADRQRGITGETLLQLLERRFDNVILTPHIGGSTAEAQANMGGEVASKLIRYSNNGSTLTSVNFPEVTLPTLDVPKPAGQ